MADSLFIASLATLFVCYAGGAARLVAVPFILAWLFAPAIARWVSVAPADAGNLAIVEADVRSLRLIARRTWRFFETFRHRGRPHAATDNFQEDPDPVVAHRTSPTNLGLLLLSTIAARDFGWIGTLETVERLEATLATMDRSSASAATSSLVRHIRPAPARAGLYIFGRQRQSGRPSDRARQCLRGMARQSADARGTIAGAGDSLALAREALQALPTTCAPMSSRRVNWPAAWTTLRRRCRNSWAG